MATDVAFEDFSGNRGSIANESDFIDSSNIPFWGKAPDSWNTLIIAGRKLPGLATISGKAFEVRADKKKVPGESGETMTTLGREPCEPEATVRLWTEDQLTSFLSIIKMFLPIGSRALPPPVDVIHPALAMFKVRSVRVMACSYPEERDKDVFELKLKFREFFKGRGGKPKTDKQASIVAEGPGAVQEKINSFKTPDVTNGNSPRTKQADPATKFLPGTLIPGGV